MSFASGQAANIREEFLSGNNLGSVGFENYVAAYYASEITKANSSHDFINKVSLLINGMKQVLYSRSQNPKLEPSLNADSYFDNIFLDSTLSRLDLPETGEGVVDEEGNITFPGLSADEPIFDLIYGPPRSVDGQFLLSQDGLYYDSQKGGLDPVFIYLDKKQKAIKKGDKWKFAEDPNLGGRGTAISYAELQSLKSELFNVEIIDDGETMQDFYDNDHFLQVLVGQKNKHIYDTSGYLTQLISSEGEESAMVINLRQSMYSDIARHDDKINRRKKQIEIAIKAPRTFDSKVKDFKDFSLRDIPINDFSYLRDLNISVDVDSQKKLVFNQSEVSGIILPLNPKFVIAPSYSTRDLDTEEFLISDIGRGQISHAASSVSGTDANVTSLTDQIVTDGLFSIYNFLEPEVVDPGSEKYQVTNCAVDSIYNNAQLVGTSPSSVFVSGLGVPFLKGILETDETASTTPSAVGSYVMVQNTSEYRDLGYKRSGFTFESWVHVPNMNNVSTGWFGGGASSITKVLLGCENVGFPAGLSTDSPDHFDKISPDFGDTTVRGLLLGFTRDRRLSIGGAEYSNNSSNNPVGDTSFFLAPTQSVNSASSVAFLNKENYNNNSCPSSYDFHKMVVHGSSVGTHLKSYGDASSAFILVNVALDPAKDEVRMSLDGELMATSSLSEVFATKKYSPINIPTLSRSNSFEYNASSGTLLKKLQEGPKLHKSGTIQPIGFTPWIIGGGYTDGMTNNGNFMGNNRQGWSHGGVISGLRGFVGSTKFYDKAMDSTEVAKNYTSQKGFFKNIYI